MATAYTSLLGLALPVTGDLSGTWGTTVNDEITALLDSAIAGTTSITADADITLSDTDGAGNEARQAVILWNPAAGTTTRNITAPARSKAYIVINASGGTQSIVLRGAGPTTGVTIVKGEFAVCAWNGSDFVKVANQNGIGNFTTLNATTVDTTNLEVTNIKAKDGTASATIADSTGVMTITTLASTTGNITTVNATTVDTTNIEVTNLKAKDGTAAGSIADSTGVVTIASSVLTTTDINGGTIDGTAIGGSSAAAGAFTTLTASTPVGVASGGSGAATLTGVLKGNGTSAFTAATAGTDYVAPGTATTFTALQTFAGTSSNADVKTSNILETATVSATAATGTIAYDTTTQSVLYYTTNASGNFTVNFRGSSGTSLNTIMATGESLSVTFLVTNGATAYYNSAVQVDGSSVTPKWQGGTAPTSGNASSIDSYTYVIIKTGSAAFTVLASQTKFA